MKKCFLTLTALFVCLFLQAQSISDTNAPATGMRADQKIFVVVAVVVTILAGLFIYVARLDRKISRLEKQHR
jgi:CcmD family protein